MSDEAEIGIAAVDISELQPWLEGQRPLTELCARLPFLPDEAAAARYLEDLRQRLASPGRTYSTEEMLQELEKRRRARRAAA